MSFAAVASDIPSAKDIMKKRLTLGIWVSTPTLGLLPAGGASPGVGADGGSRARTGLIDKQLQEINALFSTRELRE